MGREWILRLAVLGCLLLPPSAVAAELPLWELGLGVGVLQMPEYRGSNERRSLVLPYPYLVYRGSLLRVDRERITSRIFGDRVLVDLSFSGGIPVKSDRNEARRGMPDLDPTFEVGPSLNIRLWEGDRRRFSVYLPLRAVFSTDFSSLRSRGWVANPRLVFEQGDLIPKSGLNLGISAGPLFADSSYHDYFYEVEPAYATSARPAYGARSGYSGVALSLGLNKRFQKFTINGFVSADFLKGSVIESSPLVKEKTSIMAGITFSWVFKTSQEMVSVER
ncbi:MAG: MipA/OmpV family protein [Syntrophaceae bacterium]|nr:MipA/OmpV family protein [Syntrophaceae bacterium]